MVKCVARRKFPAIGPKGCTFSSKGHNSKTHKKSHEHTKSSSTPAPSTPKSSSAVGPSTPLAFSPLYPPKRRIVPQAMSSSSSPAMSSSFTDDRPLTKAQKNINKSSWA